MVNARQANICRHLLEVISKNVKFVIGGLIFHSFFAK